MIDVSTHADRTDGRELPATPDEGPLTIEAYETDEGVVFYDADNPLAWVETSRPVSLRDLA